VSGRRANAGTRLPQGTGGQQDISALISASPEQLGQAFAQAHREGAAEQRYTTELTHQIIKSREEEIHRLQERNHELQERVLQLVDKLASLGEKSAGLALVTAQRDVALKIAEEKAKLTREGYQLGTQLIAEVKQYLPGLLSKTPPEAREVLEVLLLDEAAVDRAIEKVGADRFTAFTDWAQKI